MERKLEAARSEITMRQFLQTRLQDILTGIDRSSPTSPLYTKLFRGEKKESLVLHYNNGIDPDPAFSGTVLGRVLLEEKGNLVLITWPLEKEKKSFWRKETLLSHVSDFEFEFLVPKNGEKKGDKARPINSSWEWRMQWPKTRSEIPSIIRLSIWEEKESIPLQFAFLLPSPDPLITYWEGGQRP